MKKAILLLLLLPMLANAQYFDVFAIDTSQYPIMKAKFYSIDKNGNQILNHTPNDFEITENGETRDVINVSCYDSSPIPISVGLIVDTKKYINLARHGSERLVNLLNMPQSEVGITYMSGRPLFYQDFTNNKQKAIESSRTIPEALLGTNLSEMFSDKYIGGINIIKNRKAQNKVLIFISDLHCPNLNIDEQRLFQEARDNNIRIYTILLNTSDYSGLFGRISKETKGVLFENVKDSMEIENIFSSIVYREQNNPCEISWKSEPTCKNFVDLEILNRLVNLSAQTRFVLNDSQYLSLKLSNYFIDFGKINADTTITITSVNDSQKINKIVFEPDLGNFEIINPLPLTVNKNDSKEIKIKYTSLSSERIYTRLNIFGDYCNVSAGFISGPKNVAVSNKTLEITHPNGGEVFHAGSDTIITWEGISQNNSITLEFSENNGGIWKGLTNNALNNSFIWKVPYLESDYCLVRALQKDISKPKEEGDMEWQKSFGGSQYERARSIIQTLDGGYIIAGNSESTDGDITNPMGDSDIWIVKLDVNGDMEWQKSYGGSE